MKLLDHLLRRDASPRPPHHDATYDAENGRSSLEAAAQDDVAARAAVAQREQTRVDRVWISGRGDRSRD